MAEGVDGRLSRIEESIRNMRTDWCLRFATTDDMNKLREECRDDNENNQNIIINRMEQQDTRQAANHRELMDTVNEHVGPDTRKYIAVKTKREEQEMQIVAVKAGATPIRQVWDTIRDNKIYALIFLLLAGACARGLIETLNQLLILINNTTAHILPK